MKIFGVSLMTIFVVIAAVWFGTKNPALFSKVPVVNSL